MNRPMVTLLLALAACAAPAPIPTPAVPAPPPGPPPDVGPTAEGDVTFATFQGAQLLVKRVPGAEMAAVQLYVRGGARNTGAEDAGLEMLALRAATTGGLTLGGQALGKEQLGLLLAANGLTLDATTGRDWSTIAAKGPVGALQTALGLVTGALLAPALPEAEVELARQQQLRLLQQEEEDPDGRLRLLVNQAAWAGHPYEHRPEGTQASVAKLTRAQAAALLAKLRETTRLLLVVVADAEPAQVIASAKALLAAVPRGSWAPPPLPKPAFAAARLTGEARKIPTNYVQAVYTAPTITDPDYAAARVAIRVLSDRLFEEVRTKRNLSYSPHATFEEGEGGALGGLYVTAVDPTTTFKVMLGEVRKLYAIPLSEIDLAGARAQTRTGFAMASEATDGQARLLAQGALLAGDWRWAKGYLAQIDKVTAHEVMTFAKQHMQKLQVVILGDPAKLDHALATSL